MLDIKVLGPGCANCFIMEGLVTATVQILGEQKPELFEGVEVTLDHLSDPDDFRRYHLLHTPGLVINETVVSSGRIPTPAEVSTWVADALQAA